MRSIRSGLRFWVTTWLLLQVASLSALAPRECCAAHRAERDATPRCHQTVAETRCPMRAAGGASCPMHRGDHSGADERSTNDCSLRGNCTGPMAGMLAQLSNHGVLVSAFHVQPDLRAAAAGAVAHEHLITRRSPPDPPPPRG